MAKTLKSISLVGTKDAKNPVVSIPVQKMTDSGKIVIFNTFDAITTIKDLNLKESITLLENLKTVQDKLALVELTKDDTNSTTRRISEKEFSLWLKFLTDLKDLIPAPETTTFFNLD